MKKLNKKGFTLAELLIVVAIVGVLVAISIPIFSGKLLKAKIATNQANIRAAKAAAVADYLTEGKQGTELEYVYDIEDGKIYAKDNKSTETKYNDLVTKIKPGEDGIYKAIGVKLTSENKVETNPYASENIDSATSIKEAFENN